MSETRMPSTTHDNTTVFVDGEETAMAERRNNAPAMMQLSTWVSGTVSNDIKDFLQRPQVIYSAYTSTPPTGLVIERTIPEYPLNLAGNAMRNKVTGFLGFRATSVFTLTFNVTKFTQGRLVVAWCPNANLREPNRYDTQAISITQLPHVQVDLACNSKAVLRVPYYSVAPYANLLKMFPASNDGSNFGQVKLFVYGPISVGSQAASSEVLGLKLYCHFEDVELVTPTIEAQSGSNRRIMVNPSDKEKNKPISTGLSLVSKAAESFAKVPLLNPVFAPLAWVSGLASNVAGALGFSKPPVDSALVRVARQEFAYMNNIEGSEALIPMGSSAVNQVALSPNKLGAEFDEMSLRYVSQIPAFVYAVDWTTTDATNTSLANLRVFQDLGWTFGNTFAWGNSRVDCPLLFCIRHFMYFHGSVVLKIKVVKTTFHTGRVTLLYTPGVIVSGLTQDNPYILKEILDLTQGSEFEVTLPHANLSYWLTRPHAPGGDTFGTFQIIVDAPLAAPDTCSNSVRFLIEMAGGPDCEFAFPYDDGATVSEDGLPPNGTLNFICEETIVAQASGVEPCANLPEKGSFGGLERLDDSESILYSSQIMGESIKSFKQLTNRASRFGQVNSVGQYGCDFKVTDTITRDPVANPIAASTFISRIASCYGYATGGYKYYFTFENAATGEAPIVNVNPLGNGVPSLAGTFAAYPSPVSTNNNYDRWTNQYAGSFTSTNLLSIVVPSYNQLPMRVISPKVSQAASARVAVSVQTQGPYNGYINAWRALGEDGRFSYWLGTPYLTPVGIA